MVRGMDVEARESLPATVTDETVLKTIEVRSNLYPAQDGNFKKKPEYGQRGLGFA